MRIRIARFVGSCGLALVVGTASSAGPRDADDGERLARSLYFEGVPYAEARELADADVASLIALLDDPDESRSHAQAIAALGMSGSPDAFPAIQAYAAAGVSGDLPRERFRALRAVPIALGHLARDDERALRWLLAAARPDPTSTQRFRNIGPERLRTLLRRGALTGLALSGDPTAHGVLSQLAGSPDQPRIAAHAAESLKLHRRVVEEGPDAVFAEDAL